MRSILNNSLKDHFFWKHIVGRTSIFALPKNQLYEGVHTLMRFFYATVLIVVFVHLFNVHDVATSQIVEPLWPVFFVDQDNLLFVTFFLQISLILTTVLAVIRHIQSFRIGVFIFYFLYAALINSFGKINHGLHFILIPLFCFALIPNKTSAHFKEKALLMFLSAKFFLLLAYSLTGFWKLFWGVIEYFTKGVSLFSGLSFRNVLILQFEIKPITFFGEWFLEHYILGYIAYLFVIYLEFFSITIFFKPTLYKTWGVLLVIMKLGLALVLDVNNYISIAAIGFLLLLSPFSKETSVINTLKSLPIVDGLVYLFDRKKKLQN